MFKLGSIVDVVSEDGTIIHSGRPVAFVNDLGIAWIDMGVNEYQRPYRASDGWHCLDRDQYVPWPRLCHHNCEPKGVQ